MNAAIYIWCALLLLTFTQHQTAAIKIKNIINEKEAGCIAKVGTETGDKWIFLKDDLDKLNGGVYNTTVGDGGPLYKWRPCKPFNIKFTDEVAENDNDCHSVYVTKEDSKGIRDCKGLGNITSFKKSKDGQLELHYNFAKDPHVYAIVQLECDEKLEHGKLECADDCTGYKPTLKYTSRYACLREEPKSIIPTKKPHSGTLEVMRKYSAGSISLIVFGILLFLYLSMGVIRGSFKGQSGCDRLPNSDFWLELPLLVRDGCRLAFTGRRPRPFDTNNRKRRKRKSRGKSYQQVSYDNMAEEVHL